MTRYIQDTAHYTEVITRMAQAKRLLWIATADLKDLYVKVKGDDTVPFLKVLNTLVQHGVEVRLCMPKNPDNPSATTLIDTLPYGERWNATYAHGYT